MAIGGVSPNIAANAYSNMQNIGGAPKITDVGAKIGGVAQNEDNFSFADLIRQGVETTVKNVKGGEELSAKAVTGEANLTDVVQAITAAEVSLQTLVSVRDRMIAAYQDIMRMPI